MLARSRNACSGTRGVVEKESRRRPWSEWKCVADLTRSGDNQAMRAVVDATDGQLALTPLPGGATARGPGRRT